MTNPVIENIRRSLGRTGRTPLDPRPAIYKSRLPESLDAESARFLEEVGKLSGVGQKLSPNSVDAALQTLVREQNVHRVTAWETPYLRQLGITEILNSLGVELVSPNADKHEMALCDLGITEADYLLPETGTLVLAPLPHSPAPSRCCRVSTWQLSVLPCCVRICIRSLPKPRPPTTCCLSPAPAARLISN